MLCCVLMCSGFRLRLRLQETPFSACFHLLHTTARGYSIQGLHLQLEFAIQMVPAEPGTSRWIDHHSTPSRAGKSMLALAVLSSQQKSPKEITPVVNLPLGLHSHGGKPSLLCFAGMQPFQAALTHLHTSQFIHFHPWLTQQTPNPIKPASRAAVSFLCSAIICFNLRAKNSS